MVIEGLPPSYYLTHINSRSNNVGKTYGTRLRKHTPKLFDRLYEEFIAKNKLHTKSSYKVGDRFIDRKHNATNTIVEEYSKDYFVVRVFDGTRYVGDVMKTSDELKQLARTL